MSEPETLGDLRERAVRAELDHLLESAAFRTSKRCREFLTYIVEQTVSGPRLKLKERSIGVDLFQLPHDFDTSQHTIVRVTATEVRKKLAQHYLAENGNHHAVRIDLPPGSYSADFKWATEPPDIQSHTAVRLPLCSQSCRRLQVCSFQEGVRRERRHRLRRILALTVMILALVAGISFFWRGHRASVVAADPKPITVSEPAFASPAGGANFRMLVGSSDSYVDRSGRVWQPDQFFSGGAVVVSPAEKISRTLDPDIYRHFRRGDFGYDIPLQPGSYELHLHFAETGLSDFISAESSGEGQRLFRVSANGKTILDFFDVVADADGSNTSDERVFRNISPAGRRLSSPEFYFDQRLGNSERNRAIARQCWGRPSNTDTSGLDIFLARFSGPSVGC